MILDFIKQTTRSFLLTFLVIWGFAVTVEYSVNRWLHPASFWVVYESTEAELDPSGHPIGMQSKGVINRPVVIEHHDILRCKTLGSDDWRFVSEQTVTVRYLNQSFIGHREFPAGADIDAQLVSGKWDYRSASPAPPATCKIEANIAFSPSFGVGKSIQLFSGEFGIAL